MNNNYTIMIRSGLFLFLLILSFSLAEAQNNEALNLMPKILPGTPEAASFGKFRKYPVNLFTGVPDISIPLYEITVGELSFPISISYHASGIKVNDWGSWVGLGWSLSAGGSINRKVMGKTDDLPNGYLTSAYVRLASGINTSTQADLDYLMNIYRGTYDVEPDIYSYSCGGKSGSFLFNQLNGYAPIIIPYDPIQVTKTFNAGVMSLAITDERGVNYQFYDGENTVNSQSSFNTSGITTWVITKMISANRQDTINFNYTTRYGQVSNDFNDYIILNDNSSGTSAYDAGTAYTGNSTVTSYEKKIQEINFKNGKVVFEASVSDRLDAFTGQKSLASLKVYSLDPQYNSYKLLKSILFYQSYFLSSPSNAIRSLRLDSLAVTDNAGSIVEKYKFVYNSQLLPVKDSRSKDYWGYYNGKSNNTLVPQMQVPYQSTITSTPGTITIGSTTYNGREPDSNYTKAAILQRIYYPTGGYTDFTFESNQYIDVQNNIRLAGGLRTRSILSYDGINAAPVIKTYKYGTNENGNGRPNFLLNNYFFQSTQTNKHISAIENGGIPVAAYISGTKRVRTFYCNPSIDIEPYDGSPVAYTTVTEYIGDASVNSGKTIYNFTDHADGLITAMIANKAIISSYHMNRGQIASTYAYVNKGSGVYQLVSSLSNSFEAFAQQFYSNVGFVSFKNVTYDSDIDTDVPGCPDNGTCANPDTYSYGFTNYDVRSADNRLTQSVETSYDQNDTIKTLVTTTNYYYDNFSHQQPTRISTTNSKGESVLVQRKYPHDFSDTSPYNTMISLNNINKVVTEQKFINGSTSLYLKTNNYLDKGSGNYVPGTIYYQVRSNTNELMALFNQYDARGNILEMQKANDVKQSIIWDYKMMYPVASVTNADYSDIAYTSFEANGQGNWTFSSSATPDPSAPTGKKVYSLNGLNNITRTGLKSSTTYIVSYWTKNTSAFTIAGTISQYPIQGKTIKGWNFFTHKITGQTQVNIGSNGLIDELRLYPATAQMTTIAYDPLIGMTSQCDANNSISYYEYDVFSRLKLIRDQDDNIIKTIEYHYKK